MRSTSFGTAISTTIVAVHREVDPLRHDVLLPDLELGELVLDMPLNGPPQRTCTGENAFFNS